MTTLSSAASPVPPFRLDNPVNRITTLHCWGEEHPPPRSHAAGPLGMTLDSPSRLFASADPTNRRRKPVFSIPGCKPTTTNEKILPSVHGWLHPWLWNSRTYGSSVFTGKKKSARNCTRRVQTCDVRGSPVVHHATQKPPPKPRPPTLPPHSTSLLNFSFMYSLNCPCNTPRGCLQAISVATCATWAPARPPNLACLGNS